MKRYVVKVKLDRPLNNLAIDVTVLTNKNMLQTEDENRYPAEILIEKEPKPKGC